MVHTAAEPSVNFPNTWRNHFQQMTIGIAEIEGLTAVLPAFPRLDCNPQLT